MNEPQPETGKEYLRVTFNFDAHPAWTKLPILKYLGFMTDTLISTEAHMLVPPEAMPELDRWRESHLAAGETGNAKMIEFLQAKGALLHNEDGPAYRVTQLFLGEPSGTECPVREEYWLNGKRSRAPVSNDGMSIHGRKTL